MADGLILLGFVAVLTTLVIMRVRRRVGFPAGRGFFAGAVAVVAIAVLLLWATQNH